MKVVFFAAKLSLIFSMLFLVACSTGKIVKTYEGDKLLVEQVAVLTAPENIVVLSINGKRVKNYLLSDLNVNYGLKPGENLVVFQYESIWAKTIRENKDAPRSEKVVSEPIEVLIDAKAGESLNFKFQSGSNVREARALAETFEAEVVDSKFIVIAQSAKVGTFAANKATAKLAEEKIAKEKNKALSGSSDLSSLEALKVLWGVATADEKKVFLVWAFQE